MDAIAERIPLADGPTRAIAPVVRDDVGLIQLAIEQRMDADQLDKIMSLLERRERYKAEQAFNAAMQKAQKEMPAIVRDKLNTHTNSMYATHEAVVTAIKPIYTDNGFSLSFTEADCPKPGQIRVVCKTRHSAGHTEDTWSDFALDNVGIKGTTNKTDIQGKFSTLTSAKRVLTLMVFNVAVANADQDGNSSSTLIGPQQVEQLNIQLEQLEKLNKPKDMGPFLKWLSEAAKSTIESLDQIPQTVFGKATIQLDRDIRKAQQEAKK